jgi:hypothetical protein
MSAATASTSGYLYPDFTESIASFSAARAYWEMLLRDVLAQKPEAGWRPMQHLVEVPDGAAVIIGEDEYALMVTTWSPLTKRGARISQFSHLVLAENEIPWCASWVENVKSESLGGSVQVLVINCVLTASNADIIRSRLTDYLILDCDGDAVTAQKTPVPM